MSATHIQSAPLLRLPAARLCAAAAAAALLCSGLLTCTTENPIDNGNEDLTIRLSLDRSGTTEADYTGSDITAILEFDDSVVCTFDNQRPEHIQFYTGSGRFRIPDEIVIGQKLRYLELPLYWTRKPGLIDTTGERYDTLFVEVGQQRSNTIRINVKNMSPSLDSLIIGDTAIGVFTTIYGANTYLYDVDTLDKVPMRVVARDPDNDQLFIEWRAIVNDTLLLRSAADEKRATYRTPLFNFRDTISIVVSDGKLGNRQVSIFLQRTTGLNVLALDSIIFADTVLKTAVPAYTVVTTILDTVNISTCFSNRLGGAVDPIGIANNGILEFLGQTGSILGNRYISSDARTTTYLTSDTTYVIDTLTLGVAVKTDTISRQIIIVQVPANRRPIIDTLTFDGIAVSSGFLRAPALDTVKIVLHAHDPDGGLDTVAVTWDGVAHQGSIVRSEKDSAWYVLPALGYDTLSFLVTDTLGFKTLDSVIVHADQLPVIDSVGVGDSLFGSTSAAIDTFSFLDSAGRTIPFALFAHDADPLDALSILWRVKSGMQTSKVFNTTTFDYIARDAAYKDTALCIVSDPYGYADSALIILSIVK